MPTGSCLCGDIVFTVDGDLIKPGACHCTQCRKQSGHYWASAECKRADLTIVGGEKLIWYQASKSARRGFCGRCGSFLFWDPSKGDVTEIALGSLDGPTGLHLDRHIFVADKGDYYDITDGLPENQQ